MKKYSIHTALSDTVWYAVLILFSLLMILPFYWTIVTSFKPDSEILTSGFWSSHFTLSQYKLAFSQVPFARYFLNSGILAVSGVLTNLTLGSLSGYAFAKLQFKGKKSLFLLLLSSMMVPGIVTMVPQYLVLKDFPLVGGNNLFGTGGTGLLNNYLAVILPGAVGAFAVFFMRQFFQTLPNELSDAAMIDGCSEFRIFWQIYLPLTKPALATLGIMTFQSSWNSFMWPLIVLNSQDMMTVPVGLASFSFNHQTNFGPLMAGTVMATLPMIVLFVFAQKYFVQGIAMTGGKN